MADQQLARIDERPVSLATADSFLSREKIELLKRTICKGATDDEFALFLAQVERMRLDPFARQIYAVKRWVWNPKIEKSEEQMTIQVGIDGYRLVALRTGQFEGRVGPMWCGQDGVWKDIWLSPEPPAAAMVGAFRTGFREPLYAVALWSEYAQYAKAKGDKPAQLTSMWKKMPALMIAKCAEALALRGAFPHELSGVYVDAEMAQAGPGTSFAGEVIEGEIIDHETGEIVKPTRATATVTASRSLPPAATAATVSPSTAPPVDLNAPMSEETRRNLLAAGRDKLDWGASEVFALAADTCEIADLSQLTEKQAKGLIKGMVEKPDAARAKLAEIQGPKDDNADVIFALEQAAATKGISEEQLRLIAWRRFSVQSYGDCTDDQLNELDAVLQLDESKLADVVLEAEEIAKQAQAKQPKQ